MRPYLSLLDHVLTQGVVRSDRTGVGTRSVFGHQMRFSLAEGFPLLTTKKVHLRSILHELLWFIRGDTNVASLKEAGVRIWDEWATAEECARFGREAGELGPIYGHQWRRFGANEQEEGIDQLANLIDGLKNNPHSRRHIITAWHPRDVPLVTLPPCHTLFQFYVAEGRLSCQLYQRSGDIFLGVPFNIASYALLTMMIAQVTGLRPGEYIHTLGDAHLYENHLEQAKLQLSREPRALPTMHLNPERMSIDDFVYEDFSLEGYEPHAGIKAPIAV